MITDGGALYTQIEEQLPNFVQTNHPKFAKFVEKYYEFLELNLLTFNDLDLNEDKPIQEVDDVTYTVTVAIGNNVYSNLVNKFFIGGTVSPTLDVSTGITYIFDQSDSTNLGHPLRISQYPDGRHTPGGEEYSNGVNVVAWGTPGTTTAQTSVYISPDIANTYLYYYCNNHSGMGGNVWVANTTPYISLENGSTDAANTNSNYIDLDRANNFLVVRLLRVILLVLLVGLRVNIQILKLMFKKLIMEIFKLVKLFVGSPLGFLQT